MAAARVWQARNKRIRVDRPVVLGVLNVTPDSFSDGGLFLSPDAALRQADRMVSEGADGIDIGGESTRPQGAGPVTDDEQIRRIGPVVAAVRTRFPELPISVDTTKSRVAAAAMGAGADIINDVSAFRLDRRMGEIAAATGAGVVLMHSRGDVADMASYRYADYGLDVVGDVMEELEASAARARDAGVGRDAIVLDPGIGFAKRSEHSLRILGSLERIVSLGYPVLVGVSRKRFVGKLSGVELADQRVAGTIGANVAALMRGARLFRVHDVAPNRQALAVAWGVITADAGIEPPAADNHDRALGSRFPGPTDDRLTPGSH